MRSIFRHVFILVQIEVAPPTIYPNVQSWFEIQPWISAGAVTPVWGVRVLGRAVEFLSLQINRAPPKIVPSPRVKLPLKHTPRAAPSSPALEIENRTSNWNQIEIELEIEIWTSSRSRSTSWWIQGTTAAPCNAMKSPTATCQVTNMNPGWAG